MAYNATGLAKRWCCMDNVVPAPKFPEMSKRSLGLAPGNLRMISVARSGDDLTVTTLPASRRDVHVRHGFAVAAQPV